MARPADPLRVFGELDGRTRFLVYSLMATALSIGLMGVWTSMNAPRDGWEPILQRRKPGRLQGYSRLSCGSFIRGSALRHGFVLTINLLEWDVRVPGSLTWTGVTKGPSAPCNRWWSNGTGVA